MKISKEKINLNVLNTAATLSENILDNELTKVKTSQPTEGLVE